MIGLFVNRLNKWLVVVVILMIGTFPVLSQQWCKSVSGNSDCEECCFERKCNVACGTYFSSHTPESLEYIGARNEAFHRHHAWSAATEHLFKARSSAQDMRLMTNTSESSLRDKKIKIHVSGTNFGNKRLYMQNKTYKKCKILIESTEHIKVMDGFTLDNSVLIIKTKNGKDVSFFNTQDIVLLNNSEFRVFSGDDIVFDSGNPWWKMGNSTTDKSKVKLVCNDDFHVKRNLTWERSEGLGSFEWYCRDDFIIGNSAPGSTRFQLRDWGICDDGSGGQKGTCPFKTYNIAFEVNLIKIGGSGSTSVTVEDKGDGNTIKRAAEPDFSASVDIIGAWNFWVELRDGNYQSNTTWAPKICGDKYANWDYNFSKKSGYNCKPGGLQGDPTDRNADLPADAERIDPRYWIYPNPNTGNFAVISENNVIMKQIKITDFKGRMVYSSPIIEAGEFNVKLPVGVPAANYILLIEDSENNTESQIISVSR